MKILKFLFLTLFVLFFSLSSQAQLLNPDASYASCKKTYQECAAIFYKGRLLVNEFSPEGKCKLEQGMRGKLSLSTVSLEEDSATPIKKIGFKVAIKNDRTQTIWMFSDRVMQEVELNDILKKCEIGDRIIFMTVDQKYSLPHHEIEIVWGC